MIDFSDMFECILAHRAQFRVPQPPPPEAVPLLDQAMASYKTIPVRDSSFPTALRSRKTLSLGFSQTEDRKHLDLPFTTPRYKFLHLDGSLLKAKETLPDLLWNLGKGFPNKG